MILSLHIPHVPLCVLGAYWPWAHRSWTHSLWEMYQEGGSRIPHLLVHMRTVGEHVLDLVEEQPSEWRVMAEGPRAHFPRTQSWLMSYALGRLREGPFALRNLRAFGTFKGGDTEMMWRGLEKSNTGVSASNTGGPASNTGGQSIRDSGVKAWLPLASSSLQEQLVSPEGGYFQEAIHDPPTGVGGQHFPLAKGSVFLAWTGFQVQHTVGQGTALLLLRSSSSGCSESFCHVQDSG